MKHFFYSLTILFILLTSCSSDDNSQNPIINPINNNNNNNTANNKQLKLTFTDNNMNLYGLNISLFESESDFLNNIVLETKVTDSNGSVTFENLGTNKYYWKVETSCIDNLSQNNSINNLSNQLTEFNISADNNRSGSIELINNTSYNFVFTANINSNPPVYGDIFSTNGSILPNTSNLYLNIADCVIVFNFTKFNGSTVVDQFQIISQVNCGQQTTINLN